MKIYTDNDASLAPLAGKTIAILGYGNQGRAQALNLRDSGLDVIVGNRQDNYREQALADGFEPLTIAEAAETADILILLTTDESQPLIWDEQIAPGLKPGDTLVWASGYNVGYDLITPPSDVDLVMVAPRMTGNYVRILYEQGRGAVAQVAVHQDATGQAWQRMMALAKGIGAARAGVFESSFREEAELDLFAEQVVWAGLVAWFEECFKLGVENGFSPELMALELYASGEASEILGLMARNGFYKQMAHHSTTSQYGTLSRAPGLINEQVKAQMRYNLLNDIKGGAFIEEWSGEQAAGSQTLAQLKEQALNNPMSTAEQAIIPLMRQSIQDTQDAPSSTAEVELIKAKFDDYDNRDWEQWVSKYHDTAEIYYNTASNPMSPQQAADMHAGSIRPLSGCYFDEDSIKIAQSTNDKGETWVTLYGNWVATFAANGRQIIVPTHIAYRFTGGKIAEEYGYWDNTAYIQAINEANAQGS